MARFGRSKLRKISSDNGLGGGDQVEGRSKVAGEVPFHTISVGVDQRPKLAAQVQRPLTIVTQLVPHASIFRRRQQLRKIFAIGLRSCDGPTGERLGGDGGGRKLAVVAAPAGDPQRLGGARGAQGQRKASGCPGSWRRAVRSDGFQNLGEGSALKIHQPATRSYLDTRSAAERVCRFLEDILRRTSAPLIGGETVSRVGGVARCGYLPGANLLVLF